MNASCLLVILVLLGLIGRNSLVVMAGCILLGLLFSGLGRIVFPLLSQGGLEIGLIFLLLYILIPYTSGKVPESIKGSMSSWKGILAFAAGVLATKLNADGLQLVKTHPEMIFGMTVGAIMGIIFFDGVPCGPIMAAAVTFVFLEIIHLLG